MLSRPHPLYGWLHLAPGDWRSTLQKQIEARDRLNDPHHSGPAPEFVAWVVDQQLPALAVTAYRRQFDARIDSLTLKLANLRQQISTGRLDLQPAADAVEAEIQQLEWWLLGAPEP